MTPLWTRDALERATRGEASGDWDSIDGLSIDSRSLRPGDLFVALRDVRDGHDFVADALDAGAAAALVSQHPDDVAADAPLLMASDPLYALECIGEAARERASGAGILAITGSVGKTSVRQALEAVLAAQGPTHASEKSFNNHWGVPLTLARMPDTARFGVFEIGMNHAGEIAPLTRMVRPHIAIVTTIAPAHLGNFDSEEEIARAKAEVFEGVLPGGIAILNRDNRWFALLADRASALGLRVIGFGAAPEAEVRLLSLSQQAESATGAADILGERVLFKLRAPGRHMAFNALAVLAAAQLAGADLARAALSLGQWEPGGGRGARRSIRFDAIDPASAFTLIDESYNANPVSVAAALETLALAEIGEGPAGKPGRRVAVLGDMLELGARSTALHAALAEAEHMARADLVFTCGPQMRALHDALPRAKAAGWAEDSAALAPMLRHALGPGDVVMVKGSLGSRMARIVEALDTIGRRRRQGALR